MMSPQYAEVSRILGQSESDRQLAIIGRALHEHIPSFQDDQAFGTAASLWERRQNTLALELEN